MTFEKFEVSKKQNVSSIAFYTAVSNILSKNFNIVPERKLGGNYMRVDFATENGHCFEIKFTTLDLKSFKKSLEHSYREQFISIFKTYPKANVTCITNILHNDFDETYVTIEGKKIEILTVENLLYLCGNDLVLRTLLLGSLNVSTENIISQPISKELEEILEQDRKMLAPYYLKNIFPEISHETDTDNNLSEKSSESIKEFCQRMCLKLPSITKGRKGYSEYEKYCQELVDNVFIANIDKTIPQRKNNCDLYRFDLVASLKENSESFWKFIYDKFNSCFIVFECKNYCEQISQDEVYTTERYLYNNALRNVAVILTRKGINENGIKACHDILKEHGKLIIVLNDEDVMACLKAYEDKYDDPINISPSDILLQKAKDFLLNLDK